MDKKKRNRWLVWGGAAVVVLSAGAGAAVYAGKSDNKATDSKQASKDGAKAGSKDDKKKEATLEFASREVTKPQMATMPGSIEFSGPLVAPNTVVVRSKASGVLLNLHVAEGSRVRNGQSLGELDLEELRYRVAERRASLEAAQAQFQQAERSYKANEDLAAKAFISSTALDNFRASMEAARGQWLAAKAQLETAQSSLRLASLVAPISGVVAKRHAVPGEKLSAEQQVLSIVDLGKLELAGLVGTHEVARLKPGMAVAVKVEGDEQPVQARISRIAPAAEPGTRSIGVTLEIANPEERFRAGQYAVARVELPDNAQRMTLPATAVINASGQDHVWVLEKGTLVRRVVTTGRRDAREGRIEILQGLKAEDQVLAARFDNLRDGASAKVVDSRAPRVASAAASAPALQ
ncbi:efflux RND transporter periplasmic adaptor subunit [Roseateles sp. DB2]|uniref:efflux RND transporter periplasmic adaptor subunit n=1 Tax=Roseateles sp. DB2 TaxID=3453717 RepID=UPI003EE9A9D1